MIRTGAPELYETPALAMTFVRKHTRWQRYGMMFLIARLSQSMTTFQVCGTSELVLAASSTMADAQGAAVVAEEVAFVAPYA